MTQNPQNAPGGEADPPDAGAMTPPGTRPVIPKAIPAEPIALELVDDTCPRCHAPLAHEAVMCVNCGYDLKANVVRDAEVGPVVAVPDSSQATGAAEFVHPGRGTTQVLATVGVFLVLAALIIAGVNARQWGAWVILGTVGVTLYNVALHTCTGVVAVIVASRLSEERFSRLELVAARMFVAVSLFYTVQGLRIPMPYIFVTTLLAWGAALGIYFLTILVLFKKDRFGTALIALAHFSMWMLLEMGTHLAAWVAAGKAAVVPGPL